MRTHGASEVTFMTPETRNPGTAATVTGVNETAHKPNEDFTVNLTASQQFWIGVMIGFSVAVAILP